MSDQRLTSHNLCGPDPRPISCGEVDALKNLVMALPIDAIVVQIGAGYGVSTLAVLEERPDLFIFSIDVASCEAEFENLKKADLGWEHVVRLLGRSQDIGKHWRIPIDMVFVDGDHSEAGVRGDIKAWLKSVKVGGVVAFHDYIPEPIPPEVKGRVVYAVDDLMGEYEPILFVERIKAFMV